MLNERGQADSCWDPFDIEAVLLSELCSRQGGSGVP